ncbi:hypothetical protein [Micromonospora carbonacea]|uniref:hypothetical protein n=1 Tax=Micromonospora carbonacea TaxID=47853 RepID=UPI0033D236DC
MTDQPTDRIPLRSIDPRGCAAPADVVLDCGHTTAQHRAGDGQAADTRSQDQAVRQLEAELRAARAELDTNDGAWRAQVAAVKREHAEAMGQLTQAWAALNAAGYAHPTASVALLIAQCAADRDTALHLVELRTAALSRRTGDLAAALRVVDAVRTGTLEDIDRAMAAYDAPADLAGPVDARRRMAAERPNGSGEGTDKGDAATEAHRGAEGDDDSLTDRLAGALADALSWFRYRSGPHHYTARIPERSITAWRVVYAEWADQVAPEGRDDAADERDHCEAFADAMERAETVRIDSRDVIWRPASGGQWQHPLYGLVDADELEAEHGPTRQALLLNTDEQDDEQEHVCDPIECACELGPAYAPPGSGEDRAQGIRPADWERVAIDATRDALSAAWPNLGAGAVAEVAVRAIIDAGLAGPGGRCPACGSTYPRTPDPADPRCPTCSAEPTPAERAEHGPTVARVLADVRARSPR